MISEFGTNFDETARNTAFYIHLFMNLAQFRSYDEKSEKKKFT